MSTKNRKSAGNAIRQIAGIISFGEMILSYRLSQK